MSIYENIIELLEANAIGYKVMHHEATHTSQASAEARGQSLQQGGKALMFKGDKGYFLAVLSAQKKIDSKKLKALVGSKKIRFVSPEELLEICGLEKGAVPPFGSPILPMPLYLDLSMLENTMIFFNAGSLTTSLALSMSDYLAICNASQGDFSETESLVP